MLLLIFMKLSVIVTKFLYKKLSIVKNVIIFKKLYDYVIIILMRL